MASNTDLRAAATAAVEAELAALEGSTGTPPEGTPAPAGEATGEAPAPGEAAPAADAGSEGGEGAAGAVEPVVPPSNEDEPPTEYFGIPLGDLPPEVRAEVIAGYQERDTFIQKLLRDKAEAAPPAADPAVVAPAAPAPAEEEAMSDKDILEYFGLDPEFETPEAKALVTLARMNLTLQEQVTAVSTRSELDSTERYWTTSLGALEKEFGALPEGVTHEAVMREAAAAKIGEPMDAYWRIMGPGRQAVMAEVTKRRAAMADALKQGQQGQQRPSGETESAPKIIDAKDSREAVKMAFAQLVKEQGLRLPEYGADD